MPSWDAFLKTAICLNYYTLRLDIQGIAQDTSLITTVSGYFDSYKKSIKKNRLNSFFK